MSAFEEHQETWDESERRGSTQARAGVAGETGRPTLRNRGLALDAPFRSPNSIHAIGCAHRPVGEWRLITVEASAALEFVGDRQSLLFEQLERQFLRKHNVPRYEAALRKEAPLPYDLTTFIKLIDVHRRTTVNAVAAAGRSSDDIEVSVLLILFKLRRR